MKGGVAIAVVNELAKHSVLLKSGSNSEFIAVKINTSPPLVVCTLYGKQEGRTPQVEKCTEVEEHLSWLSKLSVDEPETCVIIGGDWNTHVGRRLLVDNSDVLSRAGKIINDYVDEGKCYLLNSKTSGPTITHIDASGGVNRCLDLVVGNRCADERVEEVAVDTNRILTPYRYDASSGRRVYSDHLAVVFEVNVSRRPYKSPRKQVRFYNYKKELGDGRFAVYLDQQVNKMITSLNRGDSVDKVFELIRKEQDKAKSRAYGIKKTNTKSWKKIQDENIAEYRAMELEKAVDAIKEDRKNYRIPLQVFAMRKSIITAKEDMLSTVFHPETGEEVTTREEISEAILRHNELTLSQNEGQDPVLQMCTKIKLEHIETMKRVESTNWVHETIYWEEYEEAIRVLSQRNKTVYDDLKRWGPKMKILIYFALKTCYDEESLPAEFTETRLQALYKKKGSRKDLNNYRFLHLRSTLAKLFEFIVMQKVKDTMYAAFPEAQIGGKPNCRTTEHLYVLTSLMQRSVKDKKSPDGFVIVFKDVMKAFDKVGAEHELFSTALAGVKGKVLRILEMLNKRTEFSVIGDDEDRRFVKDYVGGQGTVYTCTSASLTMPQMMGWLVEMKEEEMSQTMGVEIGERKVKIRELEFVDDESSISKDIEQARIKCGLITASMDSLNVKCHPVKTKFMIIGTKEYVEKQEEELRVNGPLKIQGFEVGRSEKERYLGMQFVEKGMKETLKEQIEFRFEEARKKLVQVKRLLESPKMLRMGWLAGVVVLYESVIRSTILYSAGCWIGMTKADYKKVERRDKDLLYCLLRLARTTPLCAILNELGILTMESAIMREKISLVVHLLHGKVSVAGRLAHDELRSDQKAGLIQEVREWCKEYHIPDPTEADMSAEVIGRHIKHANKLILMEELMKRKTCDGSDVIGGKKPDYIFGEIAPALTNSQQKLLLSWRVGILNFRTRFKRSNETTKCPMCMEEEDTLFHSMWECSEVFVRRPQSDDVGVMARFLSALNSVRVEKGALPLMYV